MRHLSIPLLVLTALLPFIAPAQELSHKPMRAWWLSAPVRMPADSAAPPDFESQRKFFDSDTALRVVFKGGVPQWSSENANRRLPWKKYVSESDIIDLDSIFGKIDYAAVFAVTEIASATDRTAYFGAGSDDGLKVWINGKLVHNSFTGRGVVVDDDLIPLQLRSGKNQLLLKIQDMQGGWGFTARFPDKTVLTAKLLEAARRGNIDDAGELLKAGAAINEKAASPYTPIVAAKLAGRQDMVEWLLKAGAKDAAVPPPETIINNLYDTFNGKPYPAVVVLVAQNGKVLFKNGYGYANIEKKIPATTITKFRIGSITKQFTASSILKLQEQGKLSVSDKLSKFIPDFPKGDEVTIHHLLTHTSGIHSYTNTDSFFTKVVSPISGEDLLKYIERYPYDFKPGDDYMYNNSGYFLLGYIIEKISGKTLLQYFDETFFRPLGMKNTGIYIKGLNLAYEATGYQQTNGKFVPALDWDMSWAAGAGALYSTVEDLFIWNEAVFSGKVLSDSSIARAFTPVLLNNGKRPEGIDYGYGWGIDTFRNVRNIGHSGGLNGFLSQLARYPDENLTVVMLTNVTPQQIELNPNELAGLYLWKKLAKQASYSTQKSPGKLQLAEYTGRYDFKNIGVMTVTVEDTTLYAQLTNQQKLPIYPAAKDEFFWKAVEAKIKFQRNARGEVESGNFEQNGAKIHVKKIPDAKIVSVDTALFVKYTGRYRFKENTVITIYSSGGKLYGRANEETPFVLLPLSDTEYLIQELNATLKFIVDTSSQVESVNVLLAGQNTVAPKIK